MSDYKLETRSLFLRLLKKIPLIAVIMMVYIPVCYGFEWKGMEITPAITSVTEYNDNLLYVTKGRTSDVINRVEPSFAISVPGTRTALNLAYTAGFEFFSMHPEFNDVTHTATGMVRIQPVQHLVFTCDDTFTRAKDLAVIDLLGLRRQREWFYSNSVTPSIEYTFGSNRTLRLNYGNSIIDYDNPTISDSRLHTVNPVLKYGIGLSTFTLDYTYMYGDFDTPTMGILDGNAVGLGYEYRVTPRTSILANGLFAFRDFNGPEFTDYKVYDFLVGLRWDFTPHLSLLARGGYLRYDPDEQKAVNSFIGNLTVTYTVEDRTRFNFTADTGYEEIFASIENLGYARSWGITGTLFHTLHPFWRVELQGSYRNRDFVFAFRKDRFWTTVGALVFEPAHWFKAEVRYEHTELDSTGIGDSYKVNSVMLTLQFRY
jgi:hypothetical protein